MLFKDGGLAPYHFLENLVMTVWVIKNLLTGDDVFEAPTREAAKKRLQIFVQHLEMVSLSTSIKDYEIVEREY